VPVVVSEEAVLCVVIEVVKAALVEETAVVAWDSLVEVEDCCESVVVVVTSVEEVTDAVTYCVLRAVLVAFGDVVAEVAVVP
jgi:hypothetical protein